MKTAIIFASKYGTTEKVAAMIAEKLKNCNEIEIFSLKKNPNPDISQFEMVILGTAIYAGSALKKMKKFCRANKQVLLQKKLGLFVCGMEPTKDKQDQELQDAYPEVLHKNAVATGFMGGAFLFEKMNFFERSIIKKIAKTTTSVHQISESAIGEFVKNLQ